MPAGMNCAVDIIRLVYSTDDEVGGSNPSGTTLHSSLRATIEEDSIDSS